MSRTISALLAASAVAAPAFAGTTVSHYDDLTENFYGESFSYNGVTYHSVNNVAGVFPDGNTFEPGAGVNGLGNQVIVENATVLYNDFPGFGSANNALTFGSAYIVGNNVSLGALSTVTMDLDEAADFASLEMAYYENGPWGGIVYHLDAYSGSSVVASDSFSISDLGGRDNIAFATLSVGSVGGMTFDSLRLYATLGSDFSGPRILVDNLTVNSVPAPGTLALMGFGAVVARRRR